MLSTPWCPHCMVVSRDGLAPEITHKALLVTLQCGRAFAPPEPARRCILLLLPPEIAALSCRFQSWVHPQDSFQAEQSHLGYTGHWWELGL